MQRTPSRRLSPVPGLGLEGYTDEVSVAAGDTIRFMLSGPPGRARTSLARLVQGDPNPAGPGLKGVPVAWCPTESIDVDEQHVDFGSYVEIPHRERLNPNGSFTLALWFRPTLVEAGWHALATKWARDELAFGLYVAGDHILTMGISHDGRMAEWATAREFVEDNVWQFVACSFDAASGELRLYQVLGDRSSELICSSKRVAPGPLFPSTAPLIIGASLDTAREAGHWAHFNGKIGHPVLLDEVLSGESVTRLARGENPRDLAPLLGQWDLSREVTGSRIVDISDGGHHGRAVNVPARAVTGPFWTGWPTKRYTDFPQDYNAIHLHDDDLDDARWQPSVAIHVPDDARPGIYCLQVDGGGDQIKLVFVVRPAVPRTPLGFLVPTLTWQAYGTNNQPWSFTEDGVLDRGVCIYNLHSDASPTHYCTRRRPTRSCNPSAGFQHWGAHNVTANLYLIDWLEVKGFEYDLFTDEDLHREGSSLLEPYRCLVLGSHPEYWTAEMMIALREYLARGGRVVYLGGNGLWWVTSIDQERPYVMEVRKRPGEWPEGFPAPVGEAAAGEWQHSTTLEVGGLWTHREHPPREIVGVEYASNVFEEAGGRWGFRRLPPSYEKGAFVFEGVSGEVVGDFGLNLGSAAGFEMDAASEGWREEADAPLILARAEHEAFIPSAHFARPPVADITLWPLANNAAVFAAGSVTWTGSLSHNGYDNDVSKITENVLKRFLDRPADASIMDGD